MTSPRTVLGAGLISIIAAGMPAWAQSAPGGGETSASETDIVVTGTRTANRSRLDTLAAVDVVSSETLQEIGTTELAQALAVNLPSLNFPRPSITDGTDTVRPAVLRGLAPDQTLVLVNSKRRHAGALVNINGSIGRGSAAVDLNAIPGVAISSVEVLRDGASAQYGSDAIAGVINLRLREAREGGSASVTYGQYQTTVETTRLSREESDGATLTVAGWAGLPLGDDGFVTVSAEYLDREPTSRGDRDPRITSTADSPTGSLVTSRFGDPEVSQGTVYVNLGKPLQNGYEFYGWAGYQVRDANSAAFPRLRNPGGVPNNTQTIPDTPRGFLPLISPTVTDATIGGGFKGETSGWLVDASVVYGDNYLEYQVADTLNASIARAQTTPGNPRFGETIQREFFAGALAYSQLVANLDFSRTFGADTPTPVTLAFGIEGRRETYRIEAGEPASYSFGLGVNGQPIRVDSTGNVVTTGGSIVFSGSQGFPGLRPTDQTETDREATSAYAEIEANLTEKLRTALAVRVEDYSDFGAALNGKFSGRYDFFDGFALRGSASTGFRAPGLQQISFRSQATNFIGGVPKEILTLPATDPVSLALGARPLEPETSVNFSLGGVFQFGDLELTIDAYRIEITDRIVLSDNLGEQGNATVDAGVDAIIAGVRTGVDAARFFINGVDSVTEGLDVVARYDIDDTALGDFGITLSGNLNSTDVTRTPATARLSSLANPPTLFPQQRVLEFEKSTPRQKYSAALDWDYSLFGATLRATHYGKVLVPQSNAANNYEIASALIVNAEGRAQVGPVQLSLGADNLLDEYPTRTPIGLNGTGATSFSSFSPFGFSGRYVYGRVTYAW